MSKVILKAENIVKSFSSAKEFKLQILKSVSLDIIEGKITIIVGASGAGKSTLLHLLGGLDKPDDGKILFKDENILKFSEERIAKFRNKNIGFVFQFHHLLPEFTAAENVAVPLMILGTNLKSSLKKAEEVLSEVGLLDRKNHKPAELSGGEQQRVAVARAIVNDPSIVLADEPTGNLDSANSKIISDLIVSLNSKFRKTFVIVTHNVEMLNIADFIYEMKDGMIHHK